MNWVKRIRFLLGTFWYRLFDDQDFILGVEFLLSVFYKVSGYRLDNWVAGRFPMLPTVYPSGMPFVILLDTSTLHREWYTWEQFVNGEVTVQQGDYIGKPTDEEYISTDSAGRGWVMDIVEPVQEPDHMVDHLYSWGVALSNRSDFRFSAGSILFFEDPTTMNIPTIKVTTASGDLKVYMKLIGIQVPKTNEYDAVSGFMSQELNDCASVVWDIHQNGATYYNAKKLLACATDSVVCDEDGAISDLWTEQGWNFVRINDTIYKSKKACNLKSASAKPNKDKVATISKDKIREIAEIKMPDLNAASIEAAMSMIAGTARSMGIVVED